MREREGPASSREGEGRETHRLMPRQHIYSGSKYEELAGYARAVVDGRFVFVSGTVGADFKTGVFAQGAEAQTEQAIRNISEALTKAGSRLEDVVRIRVYVPDP